MTKCKGCNKETENNEYWCHNPVCYFIMLDAEQKEKHVNKILDSVYMGESE